MRVISLYIYKRPLIGIFIKIKTIFSDFPRSDDLCYRVLLFCLILSLG